MLYLALIGVFENFGIINLECHKQLKGPKGFFLITFYK
jgi:hypothetical protein